MKNVREGYKMTEMGEIPNSWKIENIGNLFDFYGGISISRDKQSENGVYYLHYGDIHKKNKNYFSVEEDCDWLPKIEIDINDLKEGVLLNTGDVVFADASEDYEGIGKSVVIINENNEHFVSGLHTIVAKDKVKELDTLYKKYCFHTAEVRKQFRTLATGATVYGISRSNIKDIRILVPTIEEQEQIALTLTCVDEQIEITDNLIEKTKELKKGLMQKLLTKGIGHSKFKDTEIGWIPEQWEVNQLIHIADIIDSLHETPQYQEEGFPMIRVIDVNGKDIQTVNCFRVSKDIYLKFIRKYEPKKYDIIMSRVGSYGIVSYLKNDEKVCLGQNIVVISPKINNMYLYYCLSSLVTQNQIEKMTVGSSQKTLSLENIKKIKISVPSLKEQEKIALMLISVDEQIDQYETKKEKLNELKKGLMQKFLTGKIRIKV